MGVEIGVLGLVDRPVEALVETLLDATPDCAAPATWDQLLPFLISAIGSSLNCFCFMPMLLLSQVFTRLLTCPSPPNLGPIARWCPGTER